jgi:flagellar export protein FliJ
MKPRNCWIILERKAHDQVRDLQQQIALVQGKSEQLQQTLDRLMGMYAEYQAREHTQQKQWGLQNSMNQRQFMAQLLQLRERVQRDLMHQQGLAAQLRARLIKAESERMKMQALVDQQEQAERKLQATLEQKQMDELGVRRYNMQSLL